MPNVLKKQFVAELSSRLTQNPRVAVVDFTGLTHLAFEDLRRQLKEKGASVEVIKNSLFKVALQRIGQAEAGGDDVLKGSSAIIYLPEDYISALSVFHKFASDYETVKFKVGIIDSEIYFADNLETLAKLPSKEELVIKIIMSLRSSQNRLVYAFNYGPQKLVQVLNSASQK